MYASHIMRQSARNIWLAMRDMHQLVHRLWQRPPDQKPLNAELWCDSRSYKDMFTVSPGD